MLPPTPPTLWNISDLLADLAAQEWAQRPVTQTMLRDAIASLSSPSVITPQQYKAKGDARHVTDGAITSGTPTLTSATAAFVPADVGKTVMVTRAGAANANLVTTVLAYVNATTVTLAANAGSTVSGRFTVLGTIATAGVLAALAAGANRVAQVQFPDGGFIIDAEMVLLDNQTVNLSAGTTIYQITPNKNGFKAIQRKNVWIHFNGGVLYGPGVWSVAWNGIGGNEERGIQFLGCTDSGTRLAKVKNFGLAGFVTMGAVNETHTSPDVEGTHQLGSPLAQGNSYQFAFLAIHDPTYGQCNNLKFITPSGRYVNFGINTVENIPNSTGSILISDADFQDIIGQHAGYIGTSHTRLPNFKAARCGLDGCKLFSGVANEIIRNTSITDFEVSDCPNGQAVELGISGTGYLYNCEATGKARDCSRAGTVDGDARSCTLKLKSFNALQRAFYVSGATGPTDNTWDIESDGTVEKGVLIASATSARNTLKWKGKNSSTGGGGHWMVGVNACASLVIERLECIDLLGNMTYALWIEVGGLNVRIDCTPIIKGYVTGGIKSDALSAQWHSPSAGDFTSFSTAFASQANNILPVSRLRLARTTTVNAFVPIWQLTMDDESVYHITAMLLGKLAGSAERRSVFVSATYWRDAAGVATIQGVPTVHHDQKSASFVGTYALDTPTVNDVRLLVNSAAAATYDWVAEVTVLKISP